MLFFVLAGVVPLLFAVAFVQFLSPFTIKFELTLAFLVGLVLAGVPMLWLGRHLVRLVAR